MNMKRPSELAVELSVLEQSQPYVHGQMLSMFHKTEFLERVILDAMKEGARRAALVESKWLFDNSYTHMRDAAVEAILTTAENWTIKDL